MKDYDFSGWVTKNDLKCSDGRVIRKNAFKHHDGEKVPLVWQHQHNDPENVLGHVLLENRDEGVYGYGFFNNTEKAQMTKEQVLHGDIKGLSIYANKLKQQKSMDGNNNVLHGIIREVSLVLAGANPGAFIDSVVRHSDDDGEPEIEAVICTGEEIELTHADEEETKTSEKDTDDEKVETINVKEEYENFTERQKMVVDALVGAVIEEYENADKEEKKSEKDEKDSEEELKQNDEEPKGGNNSMKYNVFENDKNNEEALKHAELLANVLADAKRYGSLKESALQHGIEDIESLFPDVTNLNKTPEFIKRETTWADKLMKKVKHTPFSRVKSQFANITEDEARAKGYIKGKYKKEEVFTLLKRITTPTTVYKKQKLDRDDIIDITDFDVVAWLKVEMRFMLQEELARAYLIGDGRSSADDDKISELNIRPVLSDEDLFTVKAQIQVKADATSEMKAKAFIKSVIKQRKNYKGSGNPDLWTTEDMIADMLLIEDANGRPIYDTLDKVKNVLRVSDIIPVPVMEGITGPNGGELAGILVNMNDYNIGSDKGGALHMYDDFDIDYNQQKYLMETRCSGALVKPYSAIEFEFQVTA